MLSIPSRAFATRWTGHALRALSTEAQPIHRKAPEQSRTPRRTAYVHEPRLHLLGKRTAAIRTWGFLGSVSDVYAIIRAVENRFGPIVEFQFDKDDLVPTKYQLVATVVFRDPESLERIPVERGEIMHILAPPVIQNRPGGIGLDELQGLIRNVGGWEKNDNTTSEESFPTRRRMIDFRITRHAVEHATHSQAPRYVPGLYKRVACAKNFLAWGGFNSLQPIEINTPIEDSELFGSSRLDNARMRRVMRYYAKVSGEPNPLEYDPNPVAQSTATQNKVVETISLEQENSLNAPTPAPTVEIFTAPAALESPIQPSSPPRIVSKPEQITPTPKKFPSRTKPLLAEEGREQLAAARQFASLLQRRQMAMEAPATVDLKKVQKVRRPPVENRVPTSAQVEERSMGIADRLASFFRLK